MSRTKTPQYCPGVCQEMSRLSFIYLVCLVIAFYIDPICSSSADGSNYGDEIANETFHELTSRQNHPQYQHSFLPQFTAYPHRFPQHGQHHYPSHPYNQIRPPRYDNNQQSIMELLHTVANNDKLRCIPRILCELASDALSQGRQDLVSSPLTVNTESFLRLLSIIDVANTSPIPIFAKAAILGYISKGNSESCLSAYPTCPRDADKLVDYLNNYNGGFFRYFNGISTKNQYALPERRILNKQANYLNYVDSRPNLDSFRSSKTLRFPVDEERSEYDRIKTAKKITFATDDSYNGHADAGNLIFPVRTGTGNLRLDSEEYLKSFDNSKQHFYNRLFRFPA